jgi:hypothetical protein
MIDRREKSHRAENLVSWPYSSEFAATTVTHHTAMMNLIGEAQKPAIMVVGACSLANLPCKNTLTTTQLTHR